MSTNREDEPEEIGKAHPTSDGAKPGTERARDEQREGGGPRYGGEAWDVADERGDRRFGVARNDDSDPSELAKGQGTVDDDAWPGSEASPRSKDGDAEEEEDAAERTSASDEGAENSGQRAGVSRGEEPPKPKAREKAPHPHSKR